MKRCWHVTLKCGAKFTMIIEEPCRVDEALRHARDRFEDRVFTVE